jgi:hypothetical protein
MDYSFRGLSLGTLGLKIGIRAPPFMLGLPQKKGDAEMMGRQKREIRTAIQVENPFSPRKRIEADYKWPKVYLGQCKRSNQN